MTTGVSTFQTAIAALACIGISGCVGVPTTLKQVRAYPGVYFIDEAHSPDEVDRLAARVCPYDYYDADVDPIRYRGRYMLYVACNQPDGSHNDASRQFVYRQNTSYEAYFKKADHFDWGALFHVVGAVGSQTAQGMAAQNGYVPSEPHETSSQRLRDLRTQHEYEENTKQQQQAQAEASRPPQGQPANGCVTQSGMQLVNTCTQTVSVVWCTMGGGFDCSRGRDMESNIPPNSSISAAPLAPPGSSIVVNYYACAGSNTAVAQGWNAKCDAQ